MRPLARTQPSQPENKMEIKIDLEEKCHCNDGFEWDVSDRFGKGKQKCSWCFGTQLRPTDLGDQLIDFLNKYYSLKINRGVEQPGSSSGS